MITKPFIKAKENRRIRAKILRDHGKATVLAAATGRDQNEAA
jgi:hypothetical protein